MENILNDSEILEITNNIIDQINEIKNVSATNFDNTYNDMIKIKEILEEMTNIINKNTVSISIMKNIVSGLEKND